MIVSDIHANWPALRIIDESYDEIAFVGDAVNYGPWPELCVQWVRQNATYAVSGNHDYSIAYDKDPQCSAPFRKAAAEVGLIHRDSLPDDQINYLAGLPHLVVFDFGGLEFSMVHSSPKNPLFGYFTIDQLAEQLDSISSDVLLVGHTHLPTIARIGRKLIINPGSVGQPKDEDPGASYAIWEDGHAEIKRITYPVEETCRGLRRMRLSEEVFNQLEELLYTGNRPKESPEVVP